jgi:aspartate aminotransferase-like enzyme
MNSPTTSYGLAFCLPLSQAIAQLEASALLLRNASEKVAASNTESFGQRIKKAVKAKMRPRVFANAPESNEETFGERVKRAVKEKSPRRQHAEQAEADRNRYKPLRPRPHTKSD